jgi:hypothetical protein
LQNNNTKDFAMPDIPIALTISIVALSLYTLLGLVLVFRRQSQTGCLSIVLMTVIVGSYLAFLIGAASSDEPQSVLVTTIAYGIVGVLLGIGIIFWLIERRGENSTQPLYSRGILSVGTGVLMAVAFFFVPIIPNSILIQPTSTPIAESVLESRDDTDNQSNIVPTAVALEITDAPILTATPTITRTPLPSPSPTRTLRAYVPPTITPTPESLRVDDQCGGVVTVNLNVRQEDDVDSDIVAIVPEGSRVALIAKNTDGTWWQTEYDGERGWISRDFVELDSICLVDNEP